MINNHTNKKPKFRSQKEFEEQLRIVLRAYESYRDVLKLSAQEAEDKTINQYDDYAEWVYRKGEFQKW